MNFKKFLVEQKEKHAVLAYGRMNPPTTGHLKVIQKVQDVAKEVGGEHHMIVSHTQDSKKNPLSGEQKVKHLKRYAPGANIKSSSKENPTVFSHAAELHKKGVTHLHVVAGSDRVPEYKKKFQELNGKPNKEGNVPFHFKKITIHSAGTRDPDAEGDTGISGTKMRKHVENNDFKSFRKGVPAHVSDKHVKELMHDVHKGMRLHEDINTKFQSILTEGVHDQSIFKVVFLAGGPGSGKDYVLDNTLSGHGLTEINSDKALEFLMDKQGLDKRMPASEEEKRNIVRGKAKNVTELRQRLALLGRNGLIINGTGDDVEKVTKIKKRLEELGYESKMVLVNTKDEVSQQRNIERGQRGGRTVPENIRREKWESVQNARTEYAKMFGDNYHEFDNSEDLRNAPPEVVKEKKGEMMDIFKQVRQFTEKPINNDKAEEWIAHEMGRKDRLSAAPSPSKTTMAAHPENPNQDKMNTMGLNYYGFGRYGKNNKVTHHSINGKLVEIPKEKPEASGSLPTPGTSMTKEPRKKKSVNEEFQKFLEEAVTVTVTGDTPEEVAKTLRLLKSEDEEPVEEENSYQYSNDSSIRVLNYFNEGVEHLDEKVKLLRDNKGKLRVFSLRRAAAKEAHLKNGEVMKHKLGYIVKIKEDTHVTIYKETIQEDGTDGSNTDPTVSTPAGESIRAKFKAYQSSKKDIHPEKNASRTTEVAKSQNYNEQREKLSLIEIRQRQKAKISESIDKNIEPGLSMAASGESIGRDMGEKIRKKDGKASQVAEMTGDETTMSIGDQKEGELKRKGINLQTFKAKKFV